MVMVVIEYKPLTNRLTTVPLSTNRIPIWCHTVSRENGRLT